MTGDSNDLGGSIHIPAENQRLDLVPAPIAAPKTANQTAWEEALINEARIRIERRTFLFWGVVAAAIVVFVMFLSYLLWAHTGTDHKVDHLLMWLLAVMPIGLVFVLIKLTSDPVKDQQTVLWPEQLVKLGEKLVDHAAEIAKKKMG